MEKIYTVKDEEADCNRCDYCDDESTYYCITQCFEDNQWKGYKRTVYEEERRKANDGN